jgi:hypothetical protein
VPKSEVLAAGVLAPPAVVIAVAGAKLPPIIDDERPAVTLQLTRVPACSAGSFPIRVGTVVVSRAHERLVV